MRRREGLIGVRVSAPEKLAIVEAAATDRIPLGEWVRRLALLRASELGIAPARSPQAQGDRRSA